MDSIDPEAEGGNEADGSEEVAGELVIAGRYSSEIFDAEEGPLDDVA